MRAACADRSGCQSRTDRRGNCPVRQCRGSRRRDLATVRIAAGAGRYRSRHDSHAEGDAFVLLDGDAVPLDPAIVGETPGSRIAAIGLGEDEPVTSAIACRGIGKRPLSPVHGALHRDPDGAVRLSWTRRARGSWTWPDLVEVPLNEEGEAYIVSFESDGERIAMWSTSSPELVITAGEQAALGGVFSSGTFVIRQQGKFALSPGLVVPVTL